MNGNTHAAAPSRDLIVAELVARTGIDEPMIDRLVRAFYGRARLDPLLGPVFEHNVHDWEGHLGRICAFWSSVALMSGRYHGQPMLAHQRLPIDTPHFRSLARNFRRDRTSGLPRAGGFVFPGTCLSHRREP
jgi:hemoglobin